MDSRQNRQRKARQRKEDSRPIQELYKNKIDDKRPPKNIYSWIVFLKTRQSY